MYDYNQFKTHVVEPTLREFGLWSPAAELLLLGTVAAESSGGEYLAQLNGPALGAYQIEPNTHSDVWANYLAYRPDRLDQIRCSLGYHMRPPHERLITDLAYSTLIARLIYLRVPEPLPAVYNIPGLAAYWKSHYNTHLGKGTPDHWMDALTQWQRH